MLALTSGSSRMWPLRRTAVSFGRCVWRTQCFRRTAVALRRWESPANDVFCRRTIEGLSGFGHRACLSSGFDRSLSRSRGRPRPRVNQCWNRRRRLAPSAHGFAETAGTAGGVKIYLIGQVELKLGDSLDWLERSPKPWGWIR